jgi:putative DNA primase/helicase
MVAHAQAAAETERSPTLPLPAIDALPAELRARPQWVAVRLVPKGDGKLDKVPVDPASGRNADAGNPATWGTVEAAHAAARRRGLGIGYVFAEDDPFTGVDKDGCRDPETGELTPDAFILLGRLATYAEASISGKGIHAIARATKPGLRCRRRRGDLEMYDRLRLFAFSGAHLMGTPRAVMPRQAEVTAIYEDEFGEPELLVARPAPRPVATDDATLIERARAARDDGRFDRLWRGDDADHGGNASDADYHFCRSAAFWTGGDAARIDAWYRASGRTRPKWDERRGTRTYGAMTIAAALASQRTFYDPEGRGDDGCALVVATDAPAGECATCAKLRELLASERQQKEEVIALNRAILGVLAKKGLKQLGRAAIGIALDVQERLNNTQETEYTPEGQRYVCLNNGTAGEKVGFSDDTIGKASDFFEEKGLLHKTPKSTYGTYRDRSTGELKQGVVTKNYVALNAASSVGFLEGVMALEEEVKWGGKQKPRPTCEEHPEAGTITRTTIHCAVEACDQPLAPPHETYFTPAGEQAERPLWTLIRDGEPVRSVDPWDVSPENPQQNEETATCGTKGTGNVTESDGSVRAGVPRPQVAGTPSTGRLNFADSKNSAVQSSTHRVATTGGCGSSGANFAPHSERVADGG